MIITKAIVRSSRAAAAVAAIALLAGAVSPAMAANPDPDAAAPSPAAAKAQDQQPKKARQYCVESEITGSRIRHMVCKTRDQWIKEEGVDPVNLQAR